MDRKTIFWHTDLGNPTVPKPYRLKDGSYVFVLPEDIAKAHKLGANPKVDLVDKGVQPGAVHEYQIMGFRPSDEELSRYLREDPVGSKPFGLE